MPELPEVEFIRKRLAEGLKGHRIESVELRRPDFVRLDGRRCDADQLSDPRTSKRLLHALLEQSSDLKLQRHGKQLAIWSSSGSDGGAALALHLGMSGRLRWREGRDPEPHTHLTWTLNNGKHLDFCDPRRFGGVWCFETAQELRQKRWTSLGPDALTITAERLEVGLGRTKRPVKAALLDQSVLAGVGNIYADEALFDAGIHPSRRARALPTHAVATLADAIRKILAKAIRAGGSTFRDYRAPDGKPGLFVQQHAVYGRAQRPCRECGAILRGVLIAQRSTVFCPTCQPYRRVRS